MTGAVLAGPGTQLWRYPELTVALRWSNQVSAVERARLIARGLADRRSPENAVRFLLDKGEFQVAETVLEQIAEDGALSGQAVDQLNRELHNRQRAASDDAESQAWLLRERANRVRWEKIDRPAVEVDLPSLVKDAAERSADAAAYLAELDTQISDAEERYGASIIREREGVMATDGSGSQSAAVQAWSEEIDALIGAREFAAAQQVLANGPGSASVLPVEEPAAEWPWTTATIDEILGWFGPSRAYAPPRLRDAYVVDQAGRKLLDAIALVDVSDADAPVRLAEAVQNLIGVEGMTPRVGPAPGGGSEFVLRIPDELRLPPMAIAGRGSRVRVIIAADQPAESPAETLIWLSPRLREPKRAGLIVIDLSDLLSLLQAETMRSGRARTPASRRMGLLRIICRQLPVSSVLASQAFEGVPLPELRPQVWWLLHVFGTSPDGVAVDTLIEESGGQSCYLVRALHFTVEFAREQGFARLEPETFAQLRRSEPYRNAVELDLLEQLGDADAAGLCTIVFFTAVDDLRSALDTIAADAGLMTPIDQLLNSLDVEANLQQLGYLTTGREGAVSLRESGIIRLLRRGDPHELAKQALVRLEQAANATRSDFVDTRLQDEQFYRKLTQMELHHERLRARMAERKTLELLGETPTAVLILDDRTRRDRRQQVEEWRSERAAIELGAVCKELAREVESFSRGVEILPDIKRHAHIVGSMMALRIALHNVICNAQLAAEKNEPPTPREVIVCVDAPAADPGYAWVDVEDNGPGMPADIMDLLASGASRLPSSRHPGEGEGIVGAMALLQLLSGTLEILEVPSSLGGAHVRIRVPLAASDQVSSGSHLPVNSATAARTLAKVPVARISSRILSTSCCMCSFAMLPSPRRRSDILARPSSLPRSS
jgi:hypothetical protein